MHTIKRLFELAGMVPYAAVVILINLLLGENLTLQTTLLMACAALTGHLLRLFLLHRSTLIAHAATYEILYNIRSSIAAKMLRVPMGTMLNTPSGYYKNLIVDVVDKIEDSFAHFIPEVVSSIIAPLLCITAIFYLDVRMGFVSLLTVPAGLFFMLLAMRGYAEKSARWNRAANEMNASLVEYINGIEVIKTFNQETESYQKFSKTIVDFHDTTLDWWQHSWFCSAGVQAFLPTTLLGSLPAGAYFYMNHSLDLASFVACLVLPLGFIVPLMRLSKHSERFVTMKICVSQIDAFEKEEELHRPSAPALLSGTEIAFQHVSFGYFDQHVLHNLNFSIPPNTTTAIVGPSGSGKSTICKLIAGFWDVSQGAITIGKASVQAMPAEQLTDLIAYVAQDNFLFNMSVRDNIKIGTPDADDAQVIAAAKAARCHDFIQHLPQGYDTCTGDFGNCLSGGEKQRISIARAMLKDAPIIILDEATASVDPENEHLLMHAIRELTKGKTVISIAHRLHTVKHADQIIVLNQGAVVQKGTHEQLLAQGGLYKRYIETFSFLCDNMFVSKT